MPVEHRSATLPNGLRIVAECDPEAHSAACGFFVRTGARDEDRALMGVSHFLEHMMFKGTERYSAEDLNREFDAIGARNNAYTSSEVTCFYAHVLPERLPRALDLLADMLRPALRPDDFEREKGVILEEIAMYKDNPFWVLYEEAVERHFGPHPLGHRVLGTTETITALSRDAMLDYFNRRYSADNTTLALAGRLDFDAVAADARRLTAHWSPTRVGRDAARPRTGAGHFELRDAKVSRAYVLALADAPAADDPRRYAAAMLVQILGAPDNSRLHWALIESGLAEEAQAAYDPRVGTGEFYVYASGDPARLPRIWETIQAQIDALVPSLTDDDLERFRSRFATAYTLGGERPADRMQRVGRQDATLRTYTTLEHELDRINAVTLDDLRAVAADFPLAPTTVGRLLPAA